MALRHWKQRFDPKARFIYTKRRKFSLSPTGYMVPGEVMPEWVQAKLGVYRLRMWWRSGWIALADWEAPRPTAREVAEEPAQVRTEDEVVTEPRGSMRHLGGGVYEVTLPGGETQKVRGKKAAQELLD